MAVFGPWAFGTTEPWSIWTMNVAGFLLGALLVVKLSLRKATGIQAAVAAGNPTTPARLAGRLLALCTVGLIVFTLIAAVNARATYRQISGSFEFHRFVPWLPASFDGERTWQSFWTYLALAASFWAACDWLGASCRFGEASPKSRRPISPRLNALMWTLALSGGILACEGLLQRLSGAPRLLFTVLPSIHQEASQQFASFAYRANAAQYFNLLWPVILGFWWASSRSSSAGPFGPNILLGCTLLMIACPILSNARVAILVDLALIAGSTGVLITLGKHGPAGHVRHLPKLILWLLCAAIVVVFGLFVSWRELQPRFGSIAADLHERERLYDIGEKIVHDYPLFGTGPGSFETVFQVYRASPQSYWPAQLHNDWLEIRATLGWFGSALVMLALGLVLFRCFVSGRFGSDPPLYSLILMSVIGCLIQARWDFPLQVYSILFLFVLWAALQSSPSSDSSCATERGYVPRPGLRTSRVAMGA